jgi:hypothetical protein
VVAKGDHVGAGGEQPLGELGRDADAVGEILAVRDAEGDAELCAQAAKAVLDSTPPWRADDVADEEDFQAQRIVSVAAGRTSSATLLPASCV